ncbi:MAG: hypothetical protein IKJ55_08745, partial [Clostridia bacterium]|nr:hypothetical protein [Clostridia bacterium]
MKKIYFSQVLIIAFFAIADILGTILSVLFSEVLRFGLDFTSWFPTSVTVFTVLSILFFQLCFFLLAGVYKIYWQNAGFSDFAKLFFSSVFILFPMIPLSLISDNVFLPTDFVLFSVMLSTFCACFTRVLLHMYHRMAVRILKKHGTGKSNKRLLIVGAGEAGQIVAKDISVNANLNYNLIGFADDDPQKTGHNINGVP